MDLAPFDLHVRRALTHHLNRPGLPVFVWSFTERRQSSVALVATSSVASFLAGQGSLEKAWKIGLRPMPPAQVVLYFRSQKTIIIIPALTPNSWFGPGPSSPDKCKIMRPQHPQRTGDSGRQIGDKCKIMWPEHPQGTGDNG